MTSEPEPEIEPRPHGRTMPLSLPRRWIGDLLHFACQVPGVPVQRQMTLARVAAARAAAVPRPSWVAVFSKAFALVAVETPELRRAYLARPLPRLYEHPESVASVAVARRYGDEDAIFFARLRTPDRQPLAVLHQELTRYKTRPVEHIRSFRALIRYSRLWRPLRRLLWWYGLNGPGGQRARRFGTFGVSVYSGGGADSLHPMSPLTTVLNYGPIGPDGRVTVRVVYDHRVFDGGAAGRALARLERVLNEEILAELEGLSGPEVTRHVAA